MAIALVVGGAVLATASAQSPPTEFVPRDEAPENYPDHPNREEAFYNCTACHSFQIVSQQGMSRERWDEVMTWMTERHGMPDIQGADRDKILDYLSTAFPERQQRGWQNPFAPK